MSKKQPAGFQGVRHAYARGESTLAPTHEFTKLVSDRDRDHAMAQGPIAHFLQHTRSPHGLAPVGGSVVIDNDDEGRNAKENRAGTTAARTTSGVAGEGAERGKPATTSTVGQGAAGQTSRQKTPKTTQSSSATGIGAAGQTQRKKVQQHGVRGALGEKNEEIRREKGPIVLGSAEPAKPKSIGNITSTKPKSASSAAASAASASTSGVTQKGKSGITAGDTVKSSAGSSSATPKRPAAAKTAPVRPSSSPKTVQGGKAQNVSLGRPFVKPAAAGPKASGKTASKATPKSTSTRTGNTFMEKPKVRFEDLPDAKPRRTAMTKRATSVRHSMVDDDDEYDEPKKKSKRKR